MSKPRPASKLWLETDDGYVFGPGVYNLLKTIQKTGTLKEASQQLGMSYRYAWGLIKKAEGKLGEPLIDASKGGRLGGGSSVITEIGAEFIQDFERIQTQWLEFTSLQNTAVQGKVVSSKDIDDGVELVIQLEKSPFKKGDTVKLVSG